MVLLVGLGVVKDGILEGLEREAEVLSSATGSREKVRRVVVEAN